MKKNHWFVVSVFFTGVFTGGLIFGTRWNTEKILIFLVGIVICGAIAAKLSLKKKTVKLVRPESSFEIRRDKFIAPLSNADFAIPSTTDERTTA